MERREKISPVPEVEEPGSQSAGWNSPEQRAFGREAPKD